MILNCSSLAGCCSDPGLGRLLSISQTILFIIQIVVPIVLLVMATIQLMKLVINPDDEKKGVKSLYNKFIAAVIVFLLPSIVNLSLGVISTVVDLDDYEVLACWQSSYNDKSGRGNYITKDNSNNKKKTTVVINENDYTGKGNSSGSSGNYSKSVEGFMQAVKNTASYAKAHNYHYGNSTKNPPTSDGLISCDRLASKALWDIGYTDQKAGGETCGTLDSYLTKHGWKKSTNVNSIKYGSIVLITRGSGVAHTYVAVSYDKKTGTVVKYDEGAEWRIHANQPFKEGQSQSSIYGVYNMS